MKTNKKEESKDSFLLITKKEPQEKVFEIKVDGSVWYTCKGKYKEANNDKNIGIALGQVLLFITKNYIK